MLDANLNSAFYCSVAALAIMRPQKDGLLIHTASWAGRFVGIVPGPAYVAAKHAVVAMSYTINMEEFQHGIRSTVLCPNEVATPILDLRPKPVSAEDRARMIQPEHMADLIVYVAKLPPSICLNEIVISPTWNRGYAHARRARPEALNWRGDIMSTPRTVRLSPNDNVVVAVDPVPEGASAAGVTARARVMRGHKMAVAPIAQGRAGAQIRPDHRLRHPPIAPGDWVHTHNVEMHDFARDYRFAEGAKNDEVLPPELRATFEGYVRPGGKTGTRNYIGILTSVNCSASAARFIAREVEKSGVLDDYPDIDGVVPFVHGTGCGLAA